MRINTWLLVGLVLPRLALCAESPAQPTVGDLSRIQSDTILIEAKAKRAAAKATLQENLNKAGDDPSLPQPSAAPSVIATDLPTVTGISGAAGRLYATFLYPDGTTVRSKSGEQLPGGLLVAEVGIDRVVLTKGDRRIPLRFGVVNRPGAANSGQPMSLPGMMSPPMPAR